MRTIFNCNKCNKRLFDTKDLVIAKGTIIIKCSRCKAMNRLTNY